MQMTDATAACATVTNSGAAATLTINSSADQSFGGVITNATNALSLAKNGPANQTLSGSNSYTGETDINAGALIVNGALSSTGAVKVNTSASSAGTLAGIGSVGMVTIAADNGSNRAHISPGSTITTGSIGSLAMSSLNVNGGNMQLDITPTAGNNDSINVTGAAVFSGSSTITPIGIGGASSYTLLTASSLTLTDPPTLALQAGSPSGYCAGLQHAEHHPPG